MKQILSTLVVYIILDTLWGSRVYDDKSKHSHAFFVVVVGVYIYVCFKRDKYFEYWYTKDPPHTLRDRGMYCSDDGQRFARERRPYACQSESPLA